MNVFTCVRGQQNGQQCAFKLLRRNKESGEIEDKGCQRCGGKKGHDEYNIYPEHRSDGSVVNQNPGAMFPTDVGPTVIWENLSGHNQNGLNYDLRDFPADIHPLYHREDRNIPLSNNLSGDDTGEIFGGSEPCLVVPGWNIETFYGHDRVEHCYKGIYGKYDSKTDMVLPLCLKSYTRDIPGWIDYSTKTEWATPREFFVEGSTDAQIVAFCHDFFESADVANRIAESMIAIRDGHFVNVWILMANNFVSNEERKLFMEIVSLKTRSAIYSRHVNLQSYCELYTLLGKAEWYEEGIDENGKSVKNLKTIPREMVKLFKQNLMNWILNYPPLKVEEWYDNYATNKRFWFVCEMLRKAKKEKVLSRTAKLSMWLVKQFIDSRNAKKEFNLFGEQYDYATSPKDIQDEFCESILLRLKDGPQAMYPGMIKIKDIIQVDNDGPAWFMFCEILKAGKRWNISEIQTTWDYFKRAWIHEDASIFWDWIDCMEQQPYETEYSISKEDFLAKLEREEANAIEYPSEFAETMEIGATEFNLGEGSISPTRSFAANLMECMISSDSFEVQQRTLSEVYDARARIKKPRECNHETFWNELVRIGGLSGDKIQLKTTLSDEIHEELLESRDTRLANMDSTLETGLDSNELTTMSAFDIYSGEHEQLDGGSGSWHEEE